MKIALSVWTVILTGTVFLFPPSVQAVEYHFPGLERGSGLKISYWIKDYLHYEMLDVINAMETAFGRELNEISVSDVVEKAGRGDSAAERFLIYFYIENFFHRKNLREVGDGAGGYFQDMEVTSENMSSAQNFFRGKRAASDFMEGLLGILLMKGDFQLIEQSPQIVERSFFLLSRAKESGEREFQFVWAFLRLEFRAFVRSNDEEEAEKTILSLAREGYPPAQYIQGFLSLMDDDMDSAVGWFQKSRERNYQREASTVFLGEILAFMSDHRSEMYLREAVYDYHFEKLKPHLFQACMEQDKIVPAFHTAREIAENYTKYPVRVSLAFMSSLAGFFLTSAFWI